LAQSGEKNGARAPCAKFAGVAARRSPVAGLFDRWSERGSAVILRFFAEAFPFLVTSG